MIQLKLPHLIAASAAMLLAAGAAQARDVHWNIGINAAPGVTVGVGSGYPVYAPPVYVAPAPVYVAPPVYAAPRYYVRPAPVYYAPPRYYGPPRAHPGRGHGHGHGHHHHGHRR